MRAAQIRRALRAEPWLEPYIDADDDSIERARARFDVSQRAALRQMEADGVELHRRYVKPGGMLTTSIDQHGTVRR